jgi:hypothetical protein
VSKPLLLHGAPGLELCLTYQSPVLRTMQGHRSLQCNVLLQGKQRSGACLLLLLLLLVAVVSWPQLEGIAASYKLTGSRTCAVQAPLLMRLSGPCGLHVNRKHT